MDFVWSSQYIKQECMEKISSTINISAVKSYADLYHPPYQYLHCYIDSTICDLNQSTDEWTDSSLQILHVYNI